MGIYSREYDPNFRTYLLDQCFLNDITNGIRRSEDFQKIQKIYKQATDKSDTYKTKSKLQIYEFNQFDSTGSDQKWPNERKTVNKALAALASNDALRWTFANIIHEQNILLPKQTSLDMIDYLFDRISYSFNEIKDGIAGFRANYNWAMSPLLHQFAIRNLLASDMFKQLNIPDFQKERRYYIEQGCKLFSNGLYEDALESFMKALRIEKVDAFSLFSVGQIYLYNPNLFDPARAQEAFMRSAQYHIADKQFAQAGESYFHAAIAAYLRKDDNNSVLLAQHSFKLCPHITEANFNYVKFLAVQNNPNGLTELKSIIEKDRKYAVKALSDSDFYGIIQPLYQLIVTLKFEARANCDSLYMPMASDDNIDLYKEKNPDDYSKWATLFQEATVLYQRDTYFDYLDCFPILQKSKPFYDLCKLTSDPNASLNYKTNQLIEMYERKTGQPVFQEKVREKGIAEKEIFDILSQTKALVTHNNYAEYVSSFTPSQSSLKLLQLLDNPIALIHVGTLTGHRAGIYSVAFSPNSANIATGSEDQSIRLWGKVTNIEMITLQGHTKAVNSVAFSPDGEFLASASWDNTVRLWDINQAQQVRQFIGHKDSVESIAFSFDGQILASGSHDNTVKLWEVKTGKEILTLQGSAEAVRSVAFSPDSLMVASGSWQFVNIWDVATGKEIGNIKAHVHNYIECVAFSPDGLSLASASHDKTIKLWDSKTLEDINTLKGHSGRVNSVAYSPDGLTVASGSHDKTVKLWNIKTGRAISTISDHTDVITSVAFSPDGFTLASASQDRTVKLWSIEYKIMPKDALAEIITRNKESAFQRRSAQWRAEMRCEICGIKLGFLDTLKGKVRCADHR